MKIETTITMKFMGEINGYADTVPEKHALAAVINPVVMKAVHALTADMNSLRPGLAKLRVASYEIYTEERK